MHDLKPDPDDDGIVRYVDRLFRVMAISRTAKVALRRGKALTSLDSKETGLFDYDRVAARLRLLAGVKSLSGEGRIVLRLEYGVFLVNARFDVGDDDSLCELTMSRRN